MHLMKTAKYQIVLFFRISDAQPKIHHDTPRAKFKDRRAQSPIKVHHDTPRAKLKHFGGPKPHPNPLKNHGPVEKVSSARARKLAEKYVIFFEKYYIYKLKNAIEIRA